jgi:hypothetical protein
VAEILQVVTVTTGYTGAPGYTNMYFFGDPVNDGQVTDEVAAVAAFWNSVKSHFPNTWAASIQSDCSVLDEASGDLIRVMSTVPPVISGGGLSSAYAAGVGCCVSWGTAAVHGTKRLRGRTFLVPLANNEYDTTGTIVDSNRAAIAAAAATLAADAGFGVYGRQRDAYTDEHGSHPALSGQWAGATSGTVRDKVAILRSRRD